MQIDKNYKGLLKEIKEQILSSRIKAARSVNQELMNLYFSIGKNIAEQQEQHNWGKSIVEQLAKDLQEEFEGQTGFSSRNLWDMRRLYLAYKEFPNLRQLVAEIPWGHNLLILNKTDDIKEREYYLKASAQMGWSRNVLLNQIKANTYQHHMLDKKQHNFEKTLPAHLSEQADEALKSSYNLEFLGLVAPVLERELENKLIEKIKKLLLELGYGFCYIGNQYRLTLSDKDYFIDLLFYHRKLRCLVAIELKTGSFQPEYAGKMNFYLNLLDEQVKMENENPSIGIILCAEKTHIEVEYALKGIDKPVGVSEYELTRKLPENLNKDLPSAKELEERVTQELKKKK